MIAGFLNLLQHTDDDRTYREVHRSLDKHWYDGPVPALRVILKATGLNSTERQLQASLTLQPPRYGEVPELVDKNGDSIVQGGSVKQAATANGSKTGGTSHDRNESLS
ncbi:hypothetical protein [Lentzea sp. NPDC051838]|uniref:hypothetical protein n=1 Tax=Lentzea sp. NPDC051838 TaxID=3154849 RepID=UPI00342C9FC6